MLTVPEIINTERVTIALIIAGLIALIGWELLKRRAKRDESRKIKRSQRPITPKETRDWQ